MNGIATFSHVAINTILVGGKGAQQFEIIATAGGASVTSNAFTAGTGGRLD